LRLQKSQPQPQHFGITNAERFFLSAARVSFLVLLVFGVFTLRSSQQSDYFSEMNSSKIIVVVPLWRHNETLPLSLTSARQVKSRAAELRQPANLQPLMDPLGVPSGPAIIAIDLLFFALADAAV
jgi:hypothetical protein